MAMDPVHLAIAFLPLSLYLVVFGIANLLRRPRLTTGARNAAGLGGAVSGFAVVGPISLFLPESAANAFGVWVWVLMLAFYVLCVTLAILMARPRLVILNLAVEQLRPLLAEVAARMDGEVRWAGDSLVLPQVGMQFHVDNYPPMRSIALVAIGERQSFTGWQRLERELRQALKSMEVDRNPRGFSLLAAGLILASWPLYLMVRDGHPVAQSLREMLRL